MTSAQKMEAWESEPVSNYKMTDRTWREFMSQQSNLWSQRPTGTTSVRWLVSLLGRQSYCWNGARRYWVWELDQTRVFASTRGISFEVGVDLTTRQTLSRWRDFRNLVRQAIEEGS